MKKLALAVVLLTALGCIGDDPFYTEHGDVVNTRPPGPETWEYDISRSTGEELDPTHPLYPVVVPAKGGRKAPPTDVVQQ